MVLGHSRTLFLAAVSIPATCWYPLLLPGRRSHFCPSSRWNVGSLTTRGRTSRSGSLVTVIGPGPRLRLPVQRALPAAPASPLLRPPASVTSVGAGASTVARVAACPRGGVTPRLLAATVAARAGKPIPVSIPVPFATTGVPRCTRWASAANSQHSTLASQSLFDFPFSCCRIHRLCPAEHRGRLGASSWCRFGRLHNRSGDFLQRFCAGLQVQSWPLWWFT